MAETDCEYVALSAGLELLLYNAYLDDRDDDDDDDVIRTLVVVHGRISRCLRNCIASFGSSTKIDIFLVSAGRPLRK